MLGVMKELSILKKNQPVSNREYKFDDSTRLISSTDRNGKIQYFNDEFQRVSGFSSDQLMGSDHNLVRHPDMPPMVFKSMWDTLNANKPWMGIVKNRRQDGDHYWVSAYVTPVYQNGKKLGYESVRTAATEEQKQQAEIAYGRINKGKPAVSLLEKCSNWLKQLWPLCLVGLMTSTATLSFGGPVAGMISVTGFILLSWLILVNQRRQLDQLLSLRPDAFHNELEGLAYTNHIGKLAQVEMMIRSEAARARTGLTRISDLVEGLNSIASFTKDQANENLKLVDQQNNATQQTASAITEMASSIQEVANNVEENSKSTEAVSHQAEAASALAVKAGDAIESLNDVVNDIAETVQALSAATNEIGSAADLISAISEQTNLLALNAAIEAARAGEHGRGFSVVADEVRSLANKTRESTDKIKVVIDTLQQRSKAALQVSERGKESSKQGLSLVEQTEESLKQISASVAKVSDLTMQMASAVEQQSNVAEHINTQIIEISDGSAKATNSAHATVEEGTKLQDSSSQLAELVKRFAHKE